MWCQRSSVLMQGTSLLAVLLTRSAQPAPLTPSGAGAGAALACAVVNPTTSAATAATTVTRPDIPRRNPDIRQLPSSAVRIRHSAEPSHRPTLRNSWPDPQFVMNGD